MKNIFYSIIFISSLILGPRAVSQNVQRQPVCADPFLLHQADSIKQELSKQGFILVKEAAMAMESEYEMPVIVPLTQGIQYEFVFIGDTSSRLSEVSMYDWDEKLVASQKKQWSQPGGNVISYAYTPALTEYHIIKPVQVNKKKKNPCGYVMLLKKVNG